MIPVGTHVKVYLKGVDSVEGSLQEYDSNGVVVAQSSSPELGRYHARMVPWWMIVSIQYETTRAGQFPCPKMQEIGKSEATD